MERMHFLDDAGNRIELALIQLAKVGEEEFALFATPPEQVEEGQEPQFFILLVEYKDGERDSFSMPSDEQMERALPVMRTLIRQTMGDSSGGCGGGCSSCAGCGHSH